MVSTTLRPVLALNGLGAAGGEPYVGASARFGFRRSGNHSGMFASHRRTVTCRAIKS
jgi:hypothetical protein